LPCPLPLLRCVSQALKEGQRIDGRTPFELRAARFQFALDDSSCTVLLGRTRVMAVVAATLEAPFADRHNEGSLRFNVEFSPMASPAFESGAAVCGCFEAYGWRSSRQHSSRRTGGTVAGGCSLLWCITAGVCSFLFYFKQCLAATDSSILPPTAQGGLGRTQLRWPAW
jgi:hypothetical protein